MLPGEAPAARANEFQSQLGDEPSAGLKQPSPIKANVPHELS